MSATFDPDKRISMGVEFDSPHVVRYRLWYKKPGDTKWTTFTSGTDEEPADASVHTYTVGPLPSKSEIAYYCEFAGNPEQTFHLKIELRQNGFEVRTERVEGTTDADGVAKRDGQFILE